MPSENKKRIGVPSAGFIFDDQLPAKGVDPRSIVFDDEKEGLLGAAKDIGLTAVDAAVQLPAAAVGIADIFTGGRVGKGLKDTIGYDPKLTSEILRSLATKRQKVARFNVETAGADAAKALTDAQGITENVKAGGELVFDKAGAILQNPSVLGETVAVSLPQMLGGGFVGKQVVKGGAKVLSKLGAKGAAATVAGSEILPGVLGEGILGAGSAASDIRQDSEDGLLNLRGQFAAIMSGLGTGAFGAVGAKASKALGIGDVDILAAGGNTAAANAKGIFRRFVEGAFSEGILEELPQGVQEQMWANFANQRPLMTGVVDSMALSILSGAAMGGPVAALQSPAPQQPAPGAPPPPAYPGAIGGAAPGIPVPVALRNRPRTAQFGDASGAPMDPVAAGLRQGQFGDPATTAPGTTVENPEAIPPEVIELTDVVQRISRLETTLKAQRGNKTIQKNLNLLRARKAQLEEAGVAAPVEETPPAPTAPEVAAVASQEAAEVSRRIGNLEKIARGKQVNAVVTKNLERLRKRQAELTPIIQQGATTDDLSTLSGIGNEAGPEVQALRAEDAGVETDNRYLVDDAKRSGFAPILPKMGESEDATNKEFRGTTPDTPIVKGRDYAGKDGNRGHVTRVEDVWVPISKANNIPGVMGERRRFSAKGFGNYKQSEWTALKKDILRNGLNHPIFITKDWNGDFEISEGNHRVQAALQLGMTHIPARVQYHGNSQKQGTLVGGKADTLAAPPSAEAVTPPATVAAEGKSPQVYEPSADGKEVRVSRHKKGSSFLDPNKDIGAFIYEVRSGSEDASPLQMVLNKDGKLVTKSGVLSGNDSNGKAWVPSSEDSAKTVEDLLRKRVATKVGSQERKDIDAKISAIVKADQNKATPSASTPVIPAASAPQVGTSLTADQQTFIRGKVAKLGSKKAVAEAYTGNADVDTFARSVADEIYQGEVEAPTSAESAPVATATTDTPQQVAVRALPKWRGAPGAFTVTDPTMKMAGYVFARDKKGRVITVAPDGTVTKEKSANTWRANQLARAEKAGTVAPYVLPEIAAPTAKNVVSATESDNVVPKETTNERTQADTNELDAGAEGNFAGSSAAIQRHSRNPGETVKQFSDRQAEALREWAEQNSVLKDPAEFNTLFAEQTAENGGKPIQGTEQLVLLKKSLGIVHKLKHLIGDTETWDQYFARIAEHNRLFPNAAYTLLGFTDNQTPNGDTVFMAYVSQPYLDRQAGDAGLASTEDVAAALAELGFTERIEDATFAPFLKMGRSEPHFFKWRNPETGAVIDDLSPGNVWLSPSGEVVFMDPRIDFPTTAKSETTVAATTAKSETVAGDKTAPVGEDKKKGRTPTQLENDAKLRERRTKIDTKTDDLLMAIRKLGGIDRAQALAQWGNGAVESPAVARKAIVGKPVVRAEGGLPLDRMLSTLKGHGYFPEDADLADFEVAYGKAAAGEMVMAGDGNVTLADQLYAEEMARMAEELSSAEAARVAAEIDAESAAMIAAMDIDGVTGSAIEVFHDILENIDGQLAMSEADQTTSLLEETNDSQGNDGPVQGAPAEAAEEGPGNVEAGGRDETPSIRTEKVDGLDQGILLTNPPTFGRKRQGTGTAATLAMDDEMAIAADDALQGDLLDATPSRATDTDLAKIADGLESGAIKFPSIKRTPDGKFTVVSLDGKRLAYMEGPFTKAQLVAAIRGNIDGTAKEPWQMTPSEYAAKATGVDAIAIAKAAHPQHVKDALAEGKPVPRAVLEAYRNNVWAQRALAGRNAPPTSDVPVDNASLSEARKLRRKSELLAKEALKMLDGIAPGQPILSSRDRNLREKSAAKMREAGELDRQAEVLEARGSEAKAPATAPEEKKTTMEIRTPADRDEFTKRLNEGTLTIDEFKSAFSSLLVNKEMILAEIDKLTKPQIFEKYPGLQWRWKNEKKGDVVKALYGGFLGDFSLGDTISYGMGKNSYEDAVQAKVESYSQQDLDQYAASFKKNIEEKVQRQAELKEAVKDPKTLEDFNNYIRIKKNEGMTFADARLTLTPEQRQQYDILAGEKTRSERKDAKEDRQGSVSVAGQTVDGKIIETKHTQKGHDLFVVQLSERVSREDYGTLNAAAKKMGGGYSSFRGRGAVPGFQFRERTQAEAFIALAGGDKTAAQETVKERRDAFADDKLQSATARLTEMAEALDDNATKVMTADRKTNTNKRAQEAARAEASARKDQALAQTMRNIVSAIESGKAKFLDRVRQKVQIELLNETVRGAKWAEIKTKYEGYAEQQKHEGEKATIETADFAEWPQYVLYRSDLATLARKLIDLDGTKQIGQKILKEADDVTDAYLDFAKENLHRVATFSKKSGELAAFPSRANAEASIFASGFKGRAIVFSLKRNEHLIIMSPSEAVERGVWQGDNDKRITLNNELGAEIVEKLQRKGGSKVAVPWQLERTKQRRDVLKRMGIETPAEFRAALREFIGLQEAPKEADKIKAMERAMVGRKKDGLDFFPTPETTADEMVEAAGIEEGMTVLEPSAGMGHIADRIRETGVDPDVVEMSGDRRELLQAKGYNLVGHDFMEVEGKYDRIIMNPPFSDRRDAQHVQHAYSLLNPNGRIVAIMGEGVFFGNDKKAQEFRDWLDSLDATSEKLPEGTFNDPSLPVNTSVNARLVVIDKPGDTAFSRESRADELAGRLKTNLSRLDARKAELIAKFGPIVKGWADKPSVTVVTTEAELPAAIQGEIARSKAAGQVRAVFHEGKIYLVAENLPNDQEAEAALLHEAIGHYGMRKLFGADFGKEMLNLFAALGGRKGVEATAKRFGIDLGDYLDNNGHMSMDQFSRMAMDELLAHLAQNNIKPNVVQRIVATIRAGLRRLGLSKLMTLSDNDLIALVAQARETVVKGKSGAVVVSAAQFSKDTDKRFAILRELDRMMTELNGGVTARQTSIEVSNDQGNAGGTGSAPSGVQREIQGPGYKARAIFEALGFGNEAGELATAAVGIAGRILGGQALTPAELNGHYSNILSQFAASSPDGRTIINDILAELRKAGFTIPTSGPTAALSFMDALIKSHMAYDKFIRSGRDTRFSLRPSGGVGPSASTLSRYSPQVKNAFDYLRMKFQDKFIPLLRAQEKLRADGWQQTEENDAYRAEELFHGKASKRLEDLYADKVKPLMEEIKAGGASITEVEDYLYAKFAPQRNAYIATINPDMPDGGSGMSNAEAAQLLSGFAAAGKTAELERLAVKVREIVKMQRDIIRNEGLESEELIDAWELGNADYVPLKGGKDDKGKGIGTGFNVKGAGVKKALGRRSKAENILAHLFEQVGATIVRAEKAKVGRAFLKMAEENAGSDLFKVSDRLPMRRTMVNGQVGEVVDFSYPQKENVLTVTLDDGTVKYVEIFDDDLARVMKNLTPGQYGKVTQALAATTRFLSRMSTSLNPEFVVTNFERDIQTAMVHLGGERSAGLAKAVLKGVPGAWRGIGKALKGDLSGDWAQWFDRYQKAGAQVSFMDLRGMEDWQGKLEALGTDGKFPATKAAINKLGETIGNFNAMTENAVRLSAFRRAIEAGMSESDAASLAKNLTVNFNRKGELGPAMNALYMFANAGVQGSARIFTAMKHKRVRQILAATVMMGWGLAELARAMGGDDEDDENKFDKLSDFTKQTNLIFMDEDGGVYKIRLPYGYNVFVSMGYALSDTFHWAQGDGGKSPVDSAKFLTQAFMNAFNPLGGSGGLLNNIAPTLVDPLVELATNENFMGNKIAPDQVPYGPERPDSQLYFRGATTASKEATEFLNEVTGGSKFESGLVDISPETLDHLASFVLGGLGRTIGRTADLPGKMIEGDTEISDIPFLRNAYQEKNPRVDIDRFYANIQKVEGARDNYKEMPAPERAAFLAKHPEIRMAALSKVHRQQMSTLRKRLNLARDNGDKALAKRIEDRMNQVALQFNKAYNARIGN